MEVSVPRDLGFAVRGRRKDRGMSQDELASQLGTSRRWLSQFEQGKPTAELALALRAVRAVGLVITVEPADDPGRSSHTADTVDLDDVLDGLDDQDRW